MINVFTCQVVETDVAIHDGVVVGTGSYEGENCLDARGHYISPGFIDGHFHVESTMLSAPELARAPCRFLHHALLVRPCNPP